MADDLIAFRPPSPTDKNFILSSWAESFRRGPWSGPLPDKLYYDATRTHLEELLSRPSTQVLCCYAPGESPPNDLLGFICWGTNVLHYVYVKHLFRKEGVARALLARTGLSLPTTFTFKTRAAIEYTKDHHGWKFDPRAARYDLAATQAGRRLGDVSG